MSDLVERLRDLAGEDWLAKNHFNEAADEIGRLRAELEKADETMIRAAIREKQMADELANHKEAQDDHNRLVRELDVIWNGEAGAAKQASLCDVVSQISREWAAIKGQKPVAMLDDERGGSGAIFWLVPPTTIPNGTRLFAEPVAPAAPADKNVRLPLSAIDDVIQAVAELPDRNSPEDWPEAMLVTGDELRRILVEHIAAPVADKDAERLDIIASEYYGLEPFAMPTGGDDADVGWRVLQWHMGEKGPRTVAEVYKDNPRAAIDAAMAKGE